MCLRGRHHPDHPNTLDMFCVPRGGAHAGSVSVLRNIDRLGFGERFLVVESQLLKSSTTKQTGLLQGAPNPISPSEP